MSHKPTAEQQAVIDAFTSPDRPTLVVQAGAGCGKSSTLKMAAQAMPRRRGLYVAYNKALADEASASFPASVDCRTAHSLAFGPVGRYFKARLNGPRVPARRAAEILRLNNPVQISNELPPLAPTTLARQVLEGIGRFLNSADPEPAANHVPRIDGYLPDDNAALAKYLVPFMRRAWEDLQHPERGELKVTHDVYLKLYQLSRPRIPVDFVLLDEAQDLSPVMASLFHYQEHAQRIMVGDSAQAIYGFRGAVDAMRKFVADQRLTLSQSFRFGPAIAAEANKWLHLLDAPLRLRGFEPTASVIGSVEQPQAILCRSNAGAMAQVMQAAVAGRKVALVGGGDEVARLARAARDLLAGRPTDHPELVAFKTWDAVREHAAMDEASGNLQTLVKLIDKHTPETIIRVVEGLAAEDNADTVVSTAHKAKGREWDTVAIGGDFREPRIDPRTGRVKFAADELMLAYVAITRARLALSRGSLDWIDLFVRPTSFDQLLEASSLGGAAAFAARAAAEAETEARLTGVPVEQADWDEEPVDEPAQASAGRRRCTPDTCQGLCDEVFPDRCLWPAPLPAGAR